LFLSDGIFDPPCYLPTLMLLHEDSDACSLFSEEYLNMTI